MQTCGSVEVKLNALLPSALDGVSDYLQATANLSPKEEPLF
jgi:hypothetical protein